MSACGSLCSTWNLIEPVKHTNININGDPFYADVYGEICFKDNDDSLCSSSPLPLSSGEIILLPCCIEESFLDKEKNESPDKNQRPFNGIKKQYKHSDSFSSQNSETLSFSCTESIGFESSDDVDHDLRNNKYCFDFQIHDDDNNNNNNNNNNRISRSSSSSTSSRYSSRAENALKESKRSRTTKGSFPPPISCIGKTGKPWVYFESYRQDGRFILQEIRIPNQEFLHACREDGRLRMQLVQSDEENFEFDDDEDDDDDDFVSVDE